MPNRKIVIGLFAAATLLGASAQAPDSPGLVHLTSNLAEQGYSMSVTPTEVPAGGAIHVEIASAYPLDATCGGYATSPGFVAPISLDLVSHTRHAGDGLVVTDPGRYQATVPCTSGSPLTGSFDIVGGPSTSPPTSQPTNPSTPYVTPVGPPETGGGGTS